MCFGQLSCPRVCLCMMTRPALGSVTQACTIKKKFTALGREISGLS